MEDRLIELERRVTAAEETARQARRQVRSLRWGVAAAGALLLGLLFARPGVTQGQAIRVSKQTAPFQVVDATGRLLLLVQSGRPGPELQLFDSAGRPCVILGMGPKGGGRVDVFDRTGKPAVGLGSGDTGGGKLDVLGKGGKPVFRKP